MSTKQHSRHERTTAIVAAFCLMSSVCFLIVRNRPLADDRIFALLRVVVSFSVATLGATLPGFLNYTWSKNGLKIRAGGALALFVLTFFGLSYAEQSKEPGKTNVSQKSSGDFSPPINQNSGSITIGR